MAARAAVPLPHHKVLGVPRDAPLSEVKQAFRREALRWHPDKRPGDSEAQAAEAKRRFQAVHEAYRVLSLQRRRSSVGLSAARPGASRAPPATTSARRPPAGQAGQAGAKRKQPAASPPPAASSRTPTASAPPAADPSGADDYIGGTQFWSGCFDPSPMKDPGSASGHPNGKPAANIAAAAATPARKRPRTAPAAAASQPAHAAPKAAAQQAAQSAAKTAKPAPTAPKQGEPVRATPAQRAPQPYAQPPQATARREAAKARLDEEQARLDAERARLDAEQARLDARVRLDAERARQAERARLDAEQAMPASNPEGARLGEHFGARAVPGAAPAPPRQAHPAVVEFSPHDDSSSSSSSSRSPRLCGSFGDAAGDGLSDGEFSSNSSDNEYAEGLGFADRRGRGQPPGFGGGWGLDFEFEYEQRPREEYFEQPRRFRSATSERSHMPHRGGIPAGLSTAEALRRLEQKEERQKDRQHERDMPVGDGDSSSSGKRWLWAEDAFSDPERLRNRDSALGCLRRRLELRQERLRQKAPSGSAPPQRARTAGAAPATVSKPTGSAPATVTRENSQPVAQRVAVSGGAPSQPANLAARPPSQQQQQPQQQQQQQQVPRATPAATARPTTAAAAAAPADQQAVAKQLRSFGLELAGMRQRFESGLRFDADVARALGIFEGLRRISMNEALLRETKIGAELNQKAWRRNSSILVASESAALVKQWRSTVYVGRGKVPKDQRAKG